MRGFLSNIYLRPSCYACRAKGGACGSDITLADFWGIGNLLPEMDDDKGTSLVITHTEKGARALASISDSIDKVSVSAEEALKYNPSYSNSVSIPKCRQQFFTSFALGTPVEDIVERLLYVPKWKQLLGKVKGKIKRAAKRFIKF